MPLAGQSFTREVASLVVLSASEDDFSKSLSRKQKARYKYAPCALGIDRCVGYEKAKLRVLVPK